jgi:uncharacterized protein YbjT (DUF2867 family)
MRVLLFGGSGMVGQGVLRECLRDSEVSAVLSVGRSSTGRSAPKLEELLLPDLFDLSSIEDRLRGYDACFFCLGVSSAGMSESEYRRVTYDLTVSVARTLARLNPSMTFVYVSGAGTDSTERGRTMWARVKGQTENAILHMPFKGAFMFRPGVIRAVGGIRSKTAVYRILHALLLPALWVAQVVSPGSITTTETIGRAMIRVAATGAPTQLLGTREIYRLAHLGPPIP